MKILTVIRTAPRKRPLINRSLKSISKQFENILIAAEPDSYEPEGYNIYNWGEKKGGFKSFDAAVRLALNTSYNYFMIAEDDILMSLRAGEAAKEALKVEGLGCASLYLSKHNAKMIETNRKGWIEHKLGWKWWGSQALLFTRSSLEAMIEEKYYNWHLNNYEKNQQTDCCIMRSMKNLELKTLCHNPSLIQHIGHESTLGHHGHAMSGNIGYKFSLR